MENSGPRAGRALSIHQLAVVEKSSMLRNLRVVWSNEEGQDIAEYAVMLAAILVLVVGTVRLVGTNANTVFSSVASVVQ